MSTVKELVARKNLLAELDTTLSGLSALYRDDLDNHSGNDIAKQYNLGKLDGLSAAIQLIRGMYAGVCRDLDCTVRPRPSIHPLLFPEWR